MDRESTPVAAQPPALEPEDFYFEGPPWSSLRPITLSAAPAAVQAAAIARMAKRRNP